MQESGVDLEFDILNDIVGNLQPKDGFYELQSRPLDDVISQPPTRNLGTGADAILTELLKPKDYKMSMSRTQQKLQLQREHLLKQEQKKKEQERQRQLEQTSEISIPFTRPTETLPPHIPPAVLKFKTKLENPTKYYVFKTQERKLKEYINQHGSTPSPGFTPPTSQATLNAINNINVMPFVGDGLGMAGAVKPPDSPMSAASSTEPSEVDEIIDDIISLEGDSAVANQMGLDHNFEFFDFSAANTPLPLPAPASISDIYSGRNVSSGSLPDAISSSCPPKIKQEPNEGCGNMQKFDHVSYLKDRQKKDNHNMIERRRRFNINDRIKELGTMIPKQDMEMKQNKGTILKCTVDYIKHLKKENDRHKANIDKFRETEELNSKLLLRIQELEMHCRAHNVPVTPLTNDVSTATLSSLLASKRTAQPLLTIKPERYCNNESATCSMNTDSSAIEEDGKEYMET